MPRNIETDTDFDNDNTPPAWMDEASNALFAEYAKGDEPPTSLALIDPASWAGTDAPEREWKVKDYIPDRQATLLTGKGAAGKSLVSQQQATCIALGLPFLGVETIQTNAIYITCEDDTDELHRRQIAICASLGVKIEDLSGKLHLLSLQGEMNNELATFDHDGRIHIATRYKQIVMACDEHDIGFAVLDNTAHLFTGNENDRHQVAAFINLCNRLAISINGAVVIVGHPNKAGDSYSGSTAWENQVRSRLFMEIPENDDGSITDPDMRVMRREKSNYARRGGDLSFMWFKGAFVLPDVVPQDQRHDTHDIAKASHENDIFMNCLAKATEQRRAVSHVNGVNYAPRIFAHTPQARGVNEKDMRAAMERLLSLGKIELEANLWKGPNRHWKVGIKAVGPCANPPSETQQNRAPTPAPTPCADPRQPPSQVIENIAPTLRCADPPYTTYMEGGALEALPPSIENGQEEDWKSNPILNSKAPPANDIPPWLDEAPPIGDDDDYFDRDDHDQ
ncbi:AAA family ATPase [Sphingobium sp. BS19]|uniref:AAA family ATPase n=1 Tax=Sphingobium sp. BS19 TaxID=3018973 RepID=UPI0022EEBE2C|nr:AAA family ATPase [Sphingobium sp. BS19]GLI99146.1 hypothetical protein Sbs19_29640 [Sphingobium sp. BS19]